MDYCPPPSAAYIEYIDKHPNYSAWQLLDEKIKKYIIPIEISAFAKANNMVVTEIHPFWNGIDYIHKFYGEYTIYEIYDYNQKKFCYLLAGKKNIRFATDEEIKRFSNCPYF